MKTKYPRLNIGRPLRVGQIVQLLEGPMEVLRVSEAGAWVRPMSTKSVEINTLAGKKVTFQALRNSYQISANSEVTILAPTREEYERSRA